MDVILQRGQVCVAWSGFYHSDDVAVEVGVGRSRDQDDVKGLTSVTKPGPACLNATDLPAYTQLFSVLRATSAGGSSLFSSDGFYLVPDNDTINAMAVFNGPGCSDSDVVSTVTRNASTSLLHLSAFMALPVHPGDHFFVRVTPFDANLTFPDALVLQTTLTGYQVITMTTSLTANIPSSVGENTTIQVISCWMDVSMMPVSSSGFDVTMETAGQWAGLMKERRVEVVDQTCVQQSEKKSKYAHHQCVVASSSVTSFTTSLTLPGDVISGHFYSASVSPCFDYGCLPPASSKMVVYDSASRTFSFSQCEMTGQTANTVDVHVVAEVQPAIRDVSGHSQPCVFKWSVSRDRFGSTTLTDWLVAQSSNCSHFEVSEQCLVILLSAQRYKSRVHSNFQLQLKMYSAVSTIKHSQCHLNYHIFWCRILYRRSKMLFGKTPSVQSLARQRLWKEKGEGGSQKILNHSQS